MTDKITHNAHYRPSRITILVKHMAPYKFVLTVWLMKHWAIKARWKCQYCLRLRFSSTCGLSIHGRDSHWLISCHFMPHCDNFIRRKVANNSKTTQQWNSGVTRNSGAYRQNMEASPSSFGLRTDLFYSEVEMLRSQWMALKILHAVRSAITAIAEVLV